jgi:L-ascorbate metabolism protein UlaG (beta-lactamase superfamily)
MEISFLGLSALLLQGKKTTLLTDPFEKEKTGIPFGKKEADAILLTVRDAYTSTREVEGFHVLVDGPGEYEVGGISIIGVRGGGITTYCIKMDGITLLDLGPLRKTLTDSEFERYPNIDILFVPVGGRGSINGKDAVAMVTKLEPKVVIPIYFQTSEKEKLPLDGAETFLREMGREGVKPQTKLSLTREKLPAELEVVWLS